MYSQAPEAGIASLLASRGRNGDSMLVHMAPEEVQGLQKLAYAAGGQLSINPHTGLYEANFLKKLLPSIIGLALAPLTAGTSLAFLGNPLVAGALVGGVEGLRTGDLSKGLMAGLGAFGGAGLGAGLAGAAKAGGEAALQEVTTTAAKKAAEAAGTTAAGTTAAAAAQPTAFQTMGEGFRALGNKFGREGFMQAIPGGAAGIAAGGMGLANAFTPDVKFPDAQGQIDQSYYESEGYDPVTGTFRGGRFVPSYPGFPPRGMAEGGDVPPPSAPSYDTNLADYMSQLNQFVTSPVAPPAPPPPPPAAVAPPGSGAPIAGGDIDYSQFADLFGAGGGFGSGFGNLNFNALQQYLQGGPGGDMRWDADQGRFVSGTPATPAAPVTTTPPAGGNDMVYAGGTPGFYDQGMDFSRADFMDPSMGRDVFAGGTPNFDEMMDFQPDRAVTPEAIQAQMGNINPFAGGMPPMQAPPMAQAPQAPMPPMPPPVAQAPQPPMPPPMGQPSMPDFGMMPSPVDQLPPGTLDQYMALQAPQPPMPPMMPQFDPRQFAGLGSFNPMMYRQGGSIAPRQYAAGGKFLQGPGDGMSDDIKANINGQQEARLADGEFVVPADVVSHLGNGSSNAGSRKLYKMMANVRKARTGKSSQAPAVKTDKYLPA